VTNLNDAGMGSLRQAIIDTPSGGTVDFQAGLSGTIILSTGELAISKDLTISGPGAGVLTVSGNHASRVFDIAAAFAVSLSGLTVADGFPTGFGGGIANAGVLTVTSCTLSGNSANGGGGGGIYSNGTVTVADSTISGNSASYGGGIYNQFGGTLTVTDSIISGNSAVGAGGGIVNNEATLTVTGSTFRGNSALAGGGISGGGGMVTVTGCALSGNTASVYGGGINNFSGTLTVTSCTLSGNTASYYGGGIYNEEILVVTDSTISGNSAGAGGGICNTFGPFGTLAITGSTLSGNSATIAGSGIYNDGVFPVRGLVTLDGDYFQTAGGRLSLNIGGPQAGTDYDRLVVNGVATLAGTLDLHLVNGYQPQTGDQFQPLLFAQGQGAFAHYTGDAGRFSFVYVYDDGGFLPPSLTLVAN
jgi:hypothetical protein